MADTKISELPAATTLADTDVLPVVQGGTTKKATVALLATQAELDAHAATAHGGGGGGGRAAVFMHMGS